MNKYKSIIKRVGQNHGVAPSIIAGIISRETRAGTGAGLVNGLGGQWKWIWTHAG
ncbi:hypothetical protein J4Q44_G00286120 [Coregonus suidteri]|uniref:Uncharacterized protein n=1 Tax=Coregonus suidteri TaxID=861788 RepID=A0AAN8QD42_9TELE